MKKNMTFVAIMAIVVALTLVFTGCQKDTAPEDTATSAPEVTAAPTEAPTEAPAEATGLSGEYSFGGSTTVGAFMDAMIEAFQTANPDVAISYEGTGSSAGIEALQGGTISLAGASRAVKPAELEAGCVPHEVALDGIAVIANNSVAVDDLTLEQIAKIFTGEITDWSEVIDGAEGEIVVVNRDSASGTRATFLELVLDKVFEDAEFTTNAMEVDSNGNMVATINSTPNAIGYCGLGYLSELTDGKAVSVEGVVPSVETVSDKSYIVSRYLYFVSMGDLVKGSVEEAFYNFCLGDEGQNIIEDTGYIKMP